MGANGGTVTIDFAVEIEKANAGITQVVNHLKGFEKQLESLNRTSEQRIKQVEDRFISLDKVASRVKQALSVGALLAFAKSAILAADALGDAAERAGIAVDEFTRLKFAADQSDVEFSAFTSGLQRFQVAISKAADGTGDAKAVFSSFGVEIEKIRDLPISDQLGAVADAFGRVRDPADRTRIAVELFGKAAGPQLIPLLARGSAGIDELTATADRLGITMTDSAAKGIDRATKALGGFTTAVKAASASRFGDLITGVFGSGSEITDLEFKIKNLKLLAEQLRLTNPGDVAQLKLASDQLAILEIQLRAANEAAGGGFRMQLAPQLPWLGLQEIDLAPIQAMKIPVDDLNEAFLRLEETVARIREEQFTDALQIAADAAADRSSEVEKKISDDLEVELQRRSQASQFYRDDEVRRQEEAETAIQALKNATYSNGLAALQAFAGHSKKVAIAAILVQKAMALKEAFLAGQVAIAKAAASAPPPYNLAPIAIAKAFMVANLAAIAATGIGQIQSINSSGGAALGSAANPVSTDDSDDSSQGATSQSTVQVIIQGNVLGNQEFIDELIESIKEEVNEKDVIIISPNSRNAQDLASNA